MLCNGNACDPFPATLHRTARARRAAQLLTIALLWVMAQALTLTLQPVAVFAVEQGAAANPCNPGAAKAADPCNPGATRAAANPCNPGAAKAANPFNPCAAKAANPCNPGAAKAANPCNPCAAKAANPCNPGSATGKRNPCNPCSGAATANSSAPQLDNPCSGGAGPKVIVPASMLVLRATPRKPPVAQRDPILRQDNPLIRTMRDRPSPRRASHPQ
jgi:hypothetical protein